MSKPFHKGDRKVKKFTFRLRPCATCGLRHRTLYMFYEVARYKDHNGTYALTFSEYDDDFREFPAVKVFCSVDCALRGIKEWAKDREGERPAQQKTHSQKYFGPYSSVNDI